ncbi:unnamed protein product [Phytomonas sp. Hart1]|nr:unnamed protein product [Phytomonas sp. Hart1]|eukprot:CCW69808.1 unnamed protein product [Phytomonas sp. isolate Hart1]
MTIGSFSAVNAADRHFVWVIPKFSALKNGNKCDSKYATSFQRVKFHLHIKIEAQGNVGIYVRFKKRPIPKYSYYFENSKNESMRQHTAHTIPPDVKRCGHWCVCNKIDVMDFIGEDDELKIHFIIDDDTIMIREIPQQKTVSVIWTVLTLYNQNLNPFLSTSFIVGNTVLIARLDVKRKSTDLIANITPDNIQSFVIFLFSQGDSIPLHSIEMLDFAGKVYAQEKVKQNGAPQTITLEKSVVDANLRDDGTLQAKFTFFLLNPLEVLNFHSLECIPEVSPTFKHDGASKTGMFSTKGSYIRLDDG